MKEHEPEWLHRFKSDPHIRKTFTNEHMERIEERVAMYKAEPFREPRKGFRSVGWMAALLIMVLFGVGLYVGDFSSERSNFSSNLPEQTSPDLQVQETEQPQNESYLLRGEVQMLDQPHSFGSKPIALLTDKAQSYEIIGKEGPFVKITPVRTAATGLGSGWIPEWYIHSDDSSQIEEGEPYPLLVGDPVSFSLYPEEPIPSGFELSSGKVVQVTGRYENWLRVKIAIYDNPDMWYKHDMWIMEAALAAWDPSKAKEGALNLGASVYDEDGAVQEWPFLFGGPIRIDDSTEERYHISSVGGSSGWINKEDFSPGFAVVTFVDQSDEGEGDEEGDIDWFMSEAEIQVYEQFAKTRSDELLKGLEPLGIFRFYVTASLASDYETLHALYIKGEKYSTPDLETFLSEVQLDTVGSDNTKKLWDKLQHYELEQVIVGASAFIKITNGSDDLQDQQQFNMTQNPEGIWKVDWLALQ